MTEKRVPLLQNRNDIVQQPIIRSRHRTGYRLCVIALVCCLALITTRSILPLPFNPDDFSWIKLSESDKPQKIFYALPASWPQSSGITFEELQDILLKTPSQERARSWSQYYTSGAHLGGKNLSQAIWTKDRWEELGVRSELVSYDVYLDYPVDHRLALYDHDKLIYECTLAEDALEDDPTTNLQDSIPTFHGYSASGNVSASYVYVNYGQFSDFEELVTANISLKGKIALARYGSDLRGLKVKRAQELGMVGVVIYSDPGDDGETTEENGYEPYPAGPARNPTSVQRGSVHYLNIVAGDPTTPGYPSKPGAPREDPYLSIPKIPSLPISYADALPLLRALNGHGPQSSDFSERWQSGGLGYRGVEYNIGPTPQHITLQLYNEEQYVTTPIWNVIGIINGTMPDEAVILGNHRDAWIAGGAGDPNSGSAALNEAVRSFGAALDAGWKPLRTIVFASWDAEEHGMLGSTEWVEEYIPWLTTSAVAYLNVDVGVRGSRFWASSAPLLNTLIHQTVSLVQSPDGEGSVSDSWSGDITTLGSGSDFAGFQNFAGIPSLDFGFGSGKEDAVYHYHSNYDSFHWMDTQGDRTWERHTTVTKLWTLLAAQLAERPVLPLDATAYGASLRSYLDEVKVKASESSIGHSFDFEALENATAQFQIAATAFDRYTLGLSSALQQDLPSGGKLKLFFDISNANKVYKDLEKQFILPDGLDGRPWFKHIVFAPGRYTGYAGATYPGLIESFEDGNVTNVVRWGDIIQQRLEMATHLLQSWQAGRSGTSCPVVRR